MGRINRRLESPFARYCIAAALPVTAEITRFALHAPTLGRSITYAPFPVVSALLGGLGPGLLTTFLCVFEATYFAIQPGGSFAVNNAKDWESILILGLTGVFASLLAENLRRSQQRLRGTNDKLASMLSSMQDGFVCFDRAWRYTYVNRAASQMLRRPPEELLGKNLWDSWPLVADLPSGAAYRRAMAENLFLQVEDYYGEPLNAWFEVRCYPSPEGLSLFFTDTTERRRTRDQLRLLSSAVKQTQDGVLILSTGDGEECRPEPVFANSAFEAIVGYSLEELKAGALLELHGSGLNSFSIERPGAGCPPKCPDSDEQKIRRKDGSEIWVEFDFRPLAEGSAGFTHCVWTCRDITDRKRAAKESRLLASIIESSGEAIISKNLDGIVLTWNPGAEQVYGYSAEEMIGQPLLRLLHPARQNEVREILDYIKLGEKIKHMETERVRKDGQQICIALTISPIRDDSGEIIGASSISRDITERKRALEALERSELRYRSLAQALSEIVWTTNPQGEVVEDLPAWREFTGRTLDEILGWKWIESLHPDDRAPTAEIWLKAVQDRTTYSTEYRMRRRDGEYRWMAAHGVPMVDHEGRVQEWVGLSMDIHDRVEAEQQVRYLNRTLEERVAQRTDELLAANKELESFAYSVSHDLRAPLRSVDGFSRILLEEYAPQLSEEPHRLLGLVRKNAVQMGNLIDGLLAFSRLGRQPLHQQIVNPNELVRQALGDLELEQEGRRVEITVDELPRCQGDPLLLKQVFCNLLSNAFKYTRKRAIAHIQVGVLDADLDAFAKSGIKEPEDIPRDSVVYYIRDNGAGFDMRYVDKLFGVFQRLHNAEDYEGIGVGLATVHRIIARHGGRIWAQGVLNEGAVFYFALLPIDVENTIPAIRQLQESRSAPEQEGATS